MDRSALAALSAIAHYAAVSPQAPAVVEPNGTTLTYGDLAVQIEELSQLLQKASVICGARVAVLLPQGALQIVAVAGVLKRHACMPLQSRTTASEVESSLSRFSASALIVSPENDAEAEAAIKMGLTVVVARHGESPQEWRIHASGSPSSRPASHSDEILYLITSATTGHSKVVPLTAGNLNAGIESRCCSLQLKVSDRLLLMTSFCHIVGIENTFAQFAVGGAVIATEGFDPAGYLQWLENLKPTWYSCAPTVHQAALVKLKSVSLDLPDALRFVQSAGARLPDEVRQGLEQILQVPVFNDYGMTEACPIAVDAFLAGGRVANSAGRSVGLEIGIMNSSGEILQIGDEGEIVVRGRAVFLGYLDDPEANQNAFVDGWFRTGDAGHLDHDGNLFVGGRLKEMINRGGEKIAPSEVDAVLGSHPAVLEAVTFPVRHPTLGEDVACAIVLLPSDAPPVNAIELRRFAAQRLAAYKVPHRIFFVDEIPRGELGKPQRWLLTERLSQTQPGSPSPAEVTERLLTDGLAFYKLHEIWSRILDRVDLGFEEDFFAAGGDSLAAINMLAEVDERFGSQTSASAARFLDDPTLENLTGLVRDLPLPRPSQSAANDIRVFPVRGTGSSKRLFCVPPDQEEGLLFYRLAKYLYGKMDLAIVRPANTYYSHALFSLEKSGKETASAIRQSQPEGPYFIGGYCYGGVVAIEAARQLVLQGQDVRLILFDVPMPGSPSLLRGWKTWAERAWGQWLSLWNSDHPGITRSLRLFSHVAVWYAVVPFRRLLVPIERFSAVQRIIQWAQFDNYPLFEARPIDAPILHFLAMDEPHMMQRVSRFGWRAVARRGIEERWVPLDHANILHESNLPEIVDALREWCGGF